MGLKALEKLRDFIIFGINCSHGQNNFRKVQNWFLSHEKYSEGSEYLGKILRDILEYEQPK